MKTVVVTGGAQGIGKAIVLKFLSLGWSVVAFDNDEEAGRELVSECQNHNNLFYMPVDVSDELSVGRAIKETVRLTGNISCLVNNAAILNNKPIEELSLSEWNKVMGVNLTGAFLSARFSAPYLKTSHGSIINIVSTRALQSEAHTEAYSASKGGLLALTHSLAVSLAPNVRVNAILPGWIEVGNWKKSAERHDVTHTEADNNQHPAGRVGRPEDVSAMAAYLASDDAGFVTGADFVCDGGMTRKMIYV